MAKFLLLASLALAGCGTIMSSVSNNFTVDETKLSTVLNAQSEDLKARYEWRHPGETLSFFGIAPGMTVVEVLPGGGWYSKILVPYLGSEGHLVGVDYSLDMWPNFPFGNAEFIAQRKAWPAKWVADTSGWKLGEDGASAEAYAFGQLPVALDGTADAVLFVRALHNLSRFESKGAYLTNALAEVHRVLKPGGIVGVVQHEAPEGMAADAKADGSSGYLKKAALIQTMAAAGFTFVGETDVNHNPKDQPGAEDIVWRLPPAMYTSKDNPDLQAEYKAIGESNRMTLKFKKGS